MHRRPSTTRRILVVFAGVAALVLTACGNGITGTAAGVDGAGATSEITTEVSEPTEDSAVSDAPTDDATNGETDPDDAAATDQGDVINSAEPDTADETTAPAPALGEPEETAEADPACLVGQWQISEDTMQSYYDTINTAAAFIITGDTDLEFTSDTYEFTPDFTLDVDIQGLPGSASLTGTSGGNYDVTAGTINSSNESNDVSLTITAMGTEVDGAGMIDDFMDIFALHDTPFSCGDNGPILMFHTSNGGRTALQLEPRR